MHLCFRVESEGPKSLAIAVSLLAPEVQVLDMPVDPNEPTYCLCHQVSDAYHIGPFTVHEKTKLTQDANWAIYTSAILSM